MARLCHRVWGWFYDARPKADTYHPRAVVGSPASERVPIQETQRSSFRQAPEHPGCDGLDSKRVRDSNGPQRPPSEMDTPSMMDTSKRLLQTRPRLADRCAPGRYTSGEVMSLGPSSSVAPPCSSKFGPSCRRWSAADQYYDLGCQLRTMRDLATSTSGFRASPTPGYKLQPSLDKSIHFHCASS